MTWTVILLEEVEDWYLGLPAKSRELVAGTLDQLEARGPVLPRPLSDKINSSTIHNLKELRPGSEGSTELRILYCFDPKRQAVLLVAGDKSGDWTGWYDECIPIAEKRYQRWLDGDYDDARE